MIMDQNTFDNMTLREALMADVPMTEPNSEMQAYLDLSAEARQLLANAIASVMTAAGIDVDTKQKDLTVEDCKKLQTMMPGIDGIVRGIIQCRQM